MKQTFVLAMLGSVVAWSDTPVTANQGAPGKQGCWPVCISGPTVVVGLDGGPFNVNVTEWGGAATTLGQKVMASSVPVVVASNQSALNVSASQSGIWTVQQGTPPWSVSAVGDFNNASVSPTGVAVPASATYCGYNDGANLQGGRVFDEDTGAGTQYVAGASIRVAGAGGSTEAAAGAGVTTASTLRCVLPTDQTAIPITDNGGSITVDTPQLPAALVGGRLDTNVGAWLGSTAPTVGQKVMASSVPVVVASDQSAIASNQTQVNGVAVSTGNGIAGTGVQRVTIASDNTAFSVNNTQVGTASQNVAQFGGNAVVTGTGASGVGIPRVTVSNDSSLAANQSVNVNQWGGTNTTLGQKVMASSVPVVIASDQSAVASNQTQVNGVAVSTGNGIAGTGVQRVTIASDNTSFSVGTKTNNNAAPGATNVGALGALANAANPSWSEGNLVLESVDLSGHQRMNLGEVGGTATVNGGANGTLAIGGTQATNSAITAKPVLVGYEAQSGQPAAATTGNIRQGVASLDGVQYVRFGGPVPWTCSLDNIGATLTECQAAPGAGVKLYLTDLIITSTTAQAGQFLVRYGTGANCGTGTTSLLPAAATVARLSYAANSGGQSGSSNIRFSIPISAAANNAICIICTNTQTCTVQMIGFTAP